MCGLAGILDLTYQRKISSEYLKRMNQVQNHRGPDASGYYLEQGIGLAHSRLAIIDISTGQQPLFSADKSIVLVFNGEIYNFLALKAQLQKKGYLFHTHCDTEVIVYAWQAWGEDCVKHLRGMFAFALWDKRQHTLFLARDRLGIKPLYYCHVDAFLFFGSELKVLLAHPKVEKKMNAFALEDYCALGYIPEPKTIYQNIYKLPAGHTLCYKINDQFNRVQARQYWDIPFIPHAFQTEEETTEQLIAHLKEAVSLRMMSEVPLGAFLSGGVDSSAIVAMMSQGQEKPVNTCSIGFTELNYNELGYAKQVAKQYRTLHRESMVNPNDFSLLDQLSLVYDEPFADSSAIPTYRLCELAAKHVTVALSGDGADELMSGYRRHLWHMNEQKIRASLPLFLRKPVFGLLGACYPKVDWAPKIFRAKTTLQALARDSVDAYFNSVAIMPDRQRKALYSQAFNRELNGYRALSVFRKHAALAPGIAQQDDMAMIQYLDMKTYLVDDILTKVDRASMAHSLEVRVPILDHKLVEWISGIPSNLKIKNQQGKYIFKKALQPYLSEDILYRKKMGFSIPLIAWFRGPLKQRVKETVLNPDFLGNGYFNADYIIKMVAQHEQGVRDHSAAIWSLMMLESFQRQQL